MDSRDTDALAAGLRSWLDRGDRITGVKVLSAGHSNETYLVEGLNEILRMPPSKEGLLPPYDMARQHAIMSAVADNSDVPMPPMLELCTDPAVIGDEFFLMGAVPGEAFEYAVPEWLASDPVDGADSVCRQWFDALGALHRMNPGLLPEGGRSVPEEISHWLKVSREAEAMPALIRILEDLAASPPRTTGSETVVHGDPKHGNCMWHQGKLTVLLDWEITMIGEPMLDLGYILCFHDQGEAALANAGFDLPGWWSPARMIAEWEDRTGRDAVDPLKYTVLGQAKISAIISVGAHLYRTGRIQDPRFEGFAMVLPAYVALLQDRADRI